jgi:hypothetical protein
MARRNYTFDANMGLSDGTAAYAAAGYAQYAGQQGVVDLGGNQGVTITLPSIAANTTITPQQARFDGVCVVYVTAMTLSGSDFYKLIVVGSNNSGFASGNAVLGMLEIGEGTALDIPNGGNETAPLGAGLYPAGNEHEILFTNEQNGTPYEYVSLYNAGTFGSITYSAYIAVLPRA